MLASQTVVDVTIQALESVAPAPQAIALAKHPGGSFTFFSPLHPVNPSDWVLGQPARVALAAIALKIEPADPERLAANGLAADLAALIPARLAYPGVESRPDWHAFHGPVTKVEKLEVEGRVLWRMRIALLRAADVVLEATVYASADYVGYDFLPETGEVLTGLLWLSGYRPGD